MHLGTPVKRRERTGTGAEIMAYAAEHDYVVLTNDLDFGAILAATHRGKLSVIQVRSRNLDPGFIGATVVQALLQLEMELRAGALMTVEEAGTRVDDVPGRGVRG